MKQDRLVALVPAEVGWFGTVEEKEGFLIVTDILVPKQQVSTGSVDYDQDGMHEFLEQYAEVMHLIKYFGHSHHTMGAYWSGVDTGEFIEPMLGSASDYFICHVQNVRGESKTRIDQNRPFQASLDCDLVSLVSTEVDSWAKDQIEKLVEVKSYSKTSTTTSSSKSKETSKSDSKSTSKSSPSSSAKESSSDRTEEVDGQAIPIVSTIEDVPDEGRVVWYDSQHARHEFFNGSLVKKTYPSSSRSVNRSEQKRAEGKALATQEVAERLPQTPSQNGARRSEQRDDIRSAQAAKKTALEDMELDEESDIILPVEREDALEEVVDDDDMMIAWAGGYGVGI